jgi:hypothetical protein
VAKTPKKKKKKAKHPSPKSPQVAHWFPTFLIPKLEYFLFFELSCPKKEGNKSKSKT